MFSFSKSFGLVLFAFTLLFSLQSWAAQSGDNCTQLGVTQMASDKGAIIACLLTTPTTGPAPDCSVAGACKWQYMSGTIDKTGKAYVLTETAIAKYHAQCTEPYIMDWHNGGWGYMVCASACSRFCRDACSVAGTSCVGTFHNYDPGMGMPTKTRYTGGMISEWNGAANLVNCFCYY